MFITGMLMNLITKFTYFSLSYFPNSLKNKIRSLLPVSIKCLLGRNVMQAAVEKNSVVTVDDGRIFKSIEDRLFLRVFFEKDYEPLLSGVARKLVYKGDNVVDVGANFGWYSTLFNQCAYPGKITSYEPSPYSFDILKTNIGLNKMESTTSIRQVGVGEKSGSIFLETGSSSESGLAHITEEETKTAIEISVVTLDKDLSNQIGDISYIKLDIEGFELFALKGAKSILSNPNQPILQIELNEEALVRAGSSRNETINFLKDLGYSFYEAVPNMPGKLKSSNIKECSDVFCFGSGIFSERLEKILIS